MRRVLFVVSAIFVLGCDSNKGLRVEDKNNVSVKRSHEIVCKHPDGSVLRYKRKGTTEWSNTPFRSRNAIWQFKGERGGKMYSVHTTFCHIEEEIK